MLTSPLHCYISSFISNSFMNLFPSKRSSLALLATYLSLFSPQIATETYSTYL